MTNIISMCGGMEIVFLTDVHLDRTQIIRSYDIDEDERAFRIMKLVATFFGSLQLSWVSTVSSYGKVSFKINLCISGRRRRYYHISFTIN